MIGIGKKIISKSGLGVILIVFLILPFFVNADDIEDLKRELEEQIQQKQEEINQHQEKIQKTRSQSQTLNNEISILESEIAKIRSEISQIDLAIQRSNLNIQQIDEQIDGIENEITEKRSVLGKYIQSIAYFDQQTLLEIILKNDNFSEFFEQYNALESVQEEVQSMLLSLKELKQDLAKQREGLEQEKEQQNRLKSLQLVQKRSVEMKQGHKEDLLDKTKGQEARYQQLISGAQQEIAQIKEQLSLLEKYNISLNDAVQYAIFAAAKTGIRPAFLLGVLEAESRLGLNVGTGNWQEDMYQCYRRLGYLTQAERQKEAFLSICHSLGLNANTQPVSAEPWYGCGGAMGVAQFMPATWLAYVDQVAAITGNNPPNPWNHKDAFTAAAIKLSQGGANQRTEAGERMAYAKYLAGGNYQKWINHNVTNYVINLANKFQNQYFN